MSIRSLCLGTLVGLAGASALAQGAADVGSSIFLGPNDWPHDSGFGSFEASAPTGHGSLSMMPQPWPSVRYELHAEPGEVWLPDAALWFRLRYDFVVQGPPGLVQVQLNTAGWASGIGTASEFEAGADWVLYRDGPMWTEVATDRVGGAIDNFHDPHLDAFTSQVDRPTYAWLETGQLHHVVMTGRAEGHVLPGSWVDFDGGLALRLGFGAGFDPADYRFELSPGVGNVLPVPEPAPAALLAAGLLALVSLARARTGSRSTP